MAMNPALSAYRAHPREQARVSDLTRIVPKGYTTMLDVGARDGYVAGVMRSFFPKVIALDLEPLKFDLDGVSRVQANLTTMPFRDGAFDVVLCAEVLEHLGEDVLADGCRELCRVARHSILIGVPFQQDLRVGRTSCSQCGRPNPPWGHVNSFNEKKLRQLFYEMRLQKVSYVGLSRNRTNFFSAFLMNLAGNPWGSYDQEEPCIYCGGAIGRPGTSRMSHKLFVKVALILNRLQQSLIAASPVWIHIVFQKQK